MNLKRIILLLTLCVAFTLAAQGQRFDWVRTYTGADVSSGYATNRIVGSCVDREGNYYFLGQFSPRATLCGVPLLPDSIITYPLCPAVVVAKISPQGTLLWHKAIYGPNTSGAYPCALRQLGDTAFMVQAYFDLPYETYAYNMRFYRDLYYLDTLIPGNNAYPMPVDSVVSQTTTAFITFGNNGHVIEQHFLSVGWQDSTGRILTPRISGMNHIRQDGMHCLPLSNKTFVTDSVGNIYVLRHTQDAFSRDTLHWSITDGSITALKILVDGVHPIYCPTQRSSNQNLQILKFSPHFDSLIASTYMFDSTWMAHTDVQLNDLNIDSRGNLYVNVVGNRVDFPIRVQGTNFILDSSVTPTMMIKYSPNLQPVAMAQLSYTGSVPNTHWMQTIILYAHIDEVSNSIFMTSGVAWPPNASPTILYNNDTLDLLRGDFSWLRLDLDNLQLLSFGKIRSHTGTEAGARIRDLKITTQHNRVLGQTEFDMGIVFGDSVVTPPGAFLVWDYDGNELYATCYHHSGATCVVEKPQVIDSLVYLSGSFLGNANFGTIAVPSSGATCAYIAKYVDTSFMTPYVVRDTRTTQQINWPQVLSFPLSDSLVQLTATSTSGLPISYTCSDTSIARVVGTTLRLLAEGDATVTASQGGNNQYLPATPVTKTLHVGRAADTRTTQQINWPQELSFSLSDSPVPLTATSTSGLSVTYTCSDTSIARVVGRTSLLLLREGDATITASQGGNNQYLPATPVTKTLHVGRAVDTLNTQQIDWQQELTFPLSDDPIPLTATSSSGLPVTYTCNNPSIALIANSTLYLRAEGEATVTASQRGNSQYHPATPVAKTLHVSRAGIEASGSQRFAVYPNPAHTVVYFHSTHEQVRTVRVVSSQGREVTVPVTGSQMDISTLPAGVYYIQFVTENNVYNHKIIKM